jgi:predicted transcriptional regulator
MTKQRSKSQIIAQILDLCQGDGASKTMIVYQVNLNFRTVMTYLNLLLKKDLLETIKGDRPIYKTTPAGGRALETLRSAEEICS